MTRLLWTNLLIRKKWMQPASDRHQLPIINKHNYQTMKCKESQEQMLITRLWSRVREAVKDLRHCPRETSWVAKVDRAARRHMLEAIRSMHQVSAHLETQIIRLRVAKQRVMARIGHQARQLLRRVRPSQALATVTRRSWSPATTFSLNTWHALWKCLAATKFGRKSCLKSNSKRLRNSLRTTSGTLRTRVARTQRQLALKHRRNS